MCNISKKKFSVKINKKNSKFPEICKTEEKAVSEIIKKCGISNNSEIFEISKILKKNRIFPINLNFQKKNSLKFIKFPKLPELFI